jgi:hypothetical protein
MYNHTLKLKASNMLTFKRLYQIKMILQEERNTSEKNQAILARVRSKGLDGYLDFKKRLKMTNQDKLVDFLILTEKGLDTNEIERQLDEMAEQTLSEYSKFKKGKENLFFEGITVMSF